jgi:hypothetical protein
MRFFGDDEVEAIKYAEQLNNECRAPAPEFATLTQHEKSAVIFSLNELGPSDLAKAVAAWKAHPEIKTQVVADMVQPRLNSKEHLNTNLKFSKIAELGGVSCRTVTEWASVRRPYHKRLKVIRLGHRTVFVRPEDWEKFQQANSNMPISQTF